MEVHSECQRETFLTIRDLLSGKYHAAVFLQFASKSKFICSGKPAKLCEPEAVGGMTVTHVVSVHHTPHTP